jgi:formylglycine-generating enzyme required for sulfatase activity
VETTNSIGVKFRLIPPGEFLMGSPESEEGRWADEGPQHRVRITEPFYLGVYPVTQAQWYSVMGSNPSCFQGPQNPVENVSWSDAQEFLRKLNGQSGEPDRVYGLPTEAQWEYACRADSTTRYYFGEDASLLSEYAWYSSNSGGSTQPVGQKRPNAWGLYDMHGNVWEWCSDWYDGGYYAISPVDDPQGPAIGSIRVYRGGGWFDTPGCCRSALRSRSMPSFRRNLLGFRLAFSPVAAAGR